MPGTLIIIQARMRSTRLPGKVMLPLLGKPVLQHVIERCQAADVGRVMVATGSRLENLEIKNFCYGNNVPYLTHYSGDENDVHSRFVHVLEERSDTDTFIRVTADCPLVDPGILQWLHFVMTNHPSLSFSEITYKNGLPNGFGAQAYRVKDFLSIDKNSLTDYEREHLSVFNRPEYKERRNYPIVVQERKRPYRLTLDTPEDYAWLQHLTEQCGMDNRKIIDYLDRMTGHPGGAL